MLIRLGYDLRFELPAPTAMVALLHVHPSRDRDLREPDALQTEPKLPVAEYIDSFGNRCSRIFAPAGALRLHGSTLIVGVDEPDEMDPSAKEMPVQDLPHEVLKFLLNSRYCEVDRLSAIALDLFGGMQPGMTRVQAIVGYVHRIIQFNYMAARSTKTALDVFTERIGVCRDFQHLAITLCRALNIPARYATGYLGDFGIVVAPSPMDFSAWFEVYLSGRWWTMDARHNCRRLGRVLMATGRDASDVALTTSFGVANLTHFAVVSDWLDERAKSGIAGAHVSIESGVGQ
ncbi:MAG TPA: transglutaminase family protein [Acidobacteriaceae bacterium]|nr:transglutaminase family protein [Acidobacteriaceae bacterium]